VRYAYIRTVDSVLVNGKFLFVQAIPHCTGTRGGRGVPVVDVDVCCCWVKLRKREEEDWTRKQASFSPASASTSAAQ
jgi:hypothetical protein